MMKKQIRFVGYICLTIVLLTGCKSPRVVTAPVAPVETRYLSSKLQLTIPGGGGSMTAGGTMKVKSGDRVQISVLMPIIRTEIARLEITPKDILLIDRMNKRYVRASREELKDVLPDKAQYSMLEKLLFNAALPNGKREMSGTELGIPLLENTKVKLYDFSDVAFEMIPTAVSDKYTQVPLPELLNMLMEL